MSARAPLVGPHHCCVSPQVGAAVGAVVEVVKEDYLVASLPECGHAIAFVQSRDLNVMHVDARRRFSEGGGVFGDRIAVKRVQD